MIDFSAWVALAKAAPQAPIGATLPEPSVALRTVLEQARARPAKHPKRWLERPGIGEPLSRSVRQRLAGFRQQLEGSAHDGPTLDVVLKARRGAARPRARTRAGESTSLCREALQQKCDVVFTRRAVDGM